MSKTNEIWTQVTMWNDNEFYLNGKPLIKDLLETIEKKDDSMKWIMPKVHQGNHDGELDNCEKATCVEYRKALSLTDELK